MLPLAKEIPYQDPADILICFSDQEWVCFLDSAKQLDNIGEYSFIVFNPFTKIIASRQKININNICIEADPFTVIKQELTRYQFDNLEALPPFQGGAVGYFSYDLLHHLENVTRHKSEKLGLPDMVIGLYDTLIAFDHNKKKAWIISHGLSNNNSTPCEITAERNCEFIINRLSNKTSLEPLKKWRLESENAITSNFDKKAYNDIIQRVIDYIYNGDIFQANISQCFSAMLPDHITSLDLYLKLRKNNPAPFAAFLNYGDFSIASASPERFLKLNVDKKVETRPIKGTRRRGADPVEDEQLAKELLLSEKDLAENTMITDLMRNDLSRVCEDHSVVVQKLCGLESYATVHHLISIIEAKLKPEYTAIDLLRATFPGGSITGAPKVRAMEIISELEPTSRGPYCGSIAYIGFDGAMDSSIVIRTFVIKDKLVTFQAGGGIVADSIPQDEYMETLTKAKGLVDVLTYEG